MNAETMDPKPRASRRWLWWIPAGCLLVVLVMVAAGAALIWLVGAALGEADAYQEPLRRAQASSEVRALLGEPVEAGWLPQGQIRFNNQEGGEATLSIPLHGPRGEAVIEVRAEKRKGDEDWIYSRLEVVPAGGGTPIDLRLPASERE